MISCDKNDVLCPPPQINWGQGPPMKSPDALAVKHTKKEQIVQCITPSQTLV